MKKPLIVGNWKMKLSAREGPELARKLSRTAAKYTGVEMVLCPSFTELALVAAALKGGNALLGAQDCFWETSGAFTGEVSVTNLASYGTRYVIVGHSERRQFLGETDDMVHRKVQAVLGAKLSPIICVGESFEERQGGHKEMVVTNQVERALQGIWIDEKAIVVVAYEPVWVIGSGQAVDPDEAELTHRLIKQTLFDVLPDDIVNKQVRILYGGSVDPENVGGFIRQASVDGVLVGGASLDATQFTALVATAVKAAKQ